MKYKKIKGTNDILPDQSILWYEVRKTIIDLFYKYGFKPEISPILSPYDLFVRTIGDTTDIVNKEMFFIKNKNNIVLKPEETAVVFRSVIENNYLNDGDIKKLFYITPIFRYERPQKGRYREFYQYGIEIINSNLPERDAEIIEIGKSIINEFAIENVFLEINSIGCKHCRPEYRDELLKFLKDNKDNLCNDCKNRFEKNPLRVFDCKNNTCKLIMNNAPVIMDFLCNECKKHFNGLQKELNMKNIEFIINPKLVRGLDYYSKSVFEFIEKGGKLGSQSQLIGGGRYDYLGNEIANRSIPCVGFAGGFERLLMSISENIKERIIKNRRMDIIICFMDNTFKKYSMELCKDLRHNNYNVDIVYEYSKINKQLKYALKINAKFMIIIGEKEFNEHKITIKNLDMKKQYFIDNSIDKIKEVINEKDI